MSKILKSFLTSVKLVPEVTGSVSSGRRHSGSGGLGRRRQGREEDSRRRRRPTSEAEFSR